MIFSESLKKNKDFQVVYRKGKSYANKYLVMYILQNGSEKNRLKKLHKWQTKKNNIVNDYYHKISYNIVKHYKFIAMETLNIRGMLKGNLSRSIHEIGWGKLIEMIKYKAQWYGREFIQIDQWFPSSKKCCVCGEINHDLGRGEREWECPYCHTVHWPQPHPT